MTWPPYVGETGRRFCDRVAEHRAGIQSDPNYFGGHFSQACHTVHDAIGYKETQMFRPKIGTSIEEKKRETMD